MPTAYDVPADLLINQTAQRLREDYQEIEPPPQMAHAKTSSHKEEPPKNPHFWYIRCASLLRKVYMHGPIGVEHLREQYGGLTKKGDVGKHKTEGGGFAVRRPLEQLEKAGLVKTVERKGRKITKSGTSLLDTIAGEIDRSMRKENADQEK